MKIKPSIIIGYSSWCVLGFIRGVKYYNYNYNEYYSKYTNPEPYLYIKSITNGFMGIFMYMNPILIPFFICKEIYRLEVNIRNLENEKNSKNYNDII